jgi:hypothetical protein
MRIILPVFTLFLGMTSLFAQVPRKALVESFSNASCAPCAAQNPAFNNLLLPNKDKIITLKYQMNWPGFDPMNEQNPDDPNARRAIYNFNAIPYTRLDGELPGPSYGGGIGAWTASNAGAPAGYNQAVLNFASARETFVEVTISHEFNEELNQANVSVTVTNTAENDIPGDNIRLFLALTENQISFPTPPGSTNETTFYSVVRKLHPTAEGTLLDLKSEKENTFDFVVDLPSYLYDMRQIAFVAFVQDMSNFNVHQTEISTPITLDGLFDAAVVSKTTKPASFCELAVLPKFEIVNPGDDILNSVEIEYGFGSETSTVLWEGELAKNQKAEIEGEELNAPSGSSQLTYRVVSVNGKTDFNRMNNLLPADNISAFGPGVQGEDASVDFENTPNYAEAENTLIIKGSNLHMVVINGAEVNQQRPIGGFGQSEKAVLGNCYDMRANVTASLVLQNLDMTQKSDYTLKFDYAYASYQGESDRLIVEVSTNCGSSWTSVFDKAGTTLSTAPATTAFFVPQATQWKSETINLGNYDGREEVMVRFRVVSAWGNNIWLDNISIDGTTSSIKPVLLDENAVSIYPNPVQSEINLILNMPEAVQADIQLYDLSGRLVSVLAQGDMIPAGISNRSFTLQQAAGVYFLNVRTAKGELTKRVMVVK